MKLEELKGFNHIVIQCHDNPDADAIASGYALFEYFKSIGKKVEIIYGGNFFITKCNLQLMISELEIEIRHVDTMEQLTNKETLLITVDSQYGEGNVTRFDAENIAIIDHHQDTNKGYKYTEIISNLGACSTVVWRMLCEAGYDVNKNKNVATALYYGLFMDTSGFAEIVHPVDRDLVDNVIPNKGILSKLKNTNLSLSELETAGIALIRHICDEKNKFAIVRAKPCDPNILGIISDLLLQVNNIEVCVVYNELPFGYKLSVRSCRLDVKANEFVEYITEQIGNGGGHKDKAGGFINKDKFKKRYSDIGMEEYLLDKQRDYFKSYQVVEAGKYKPSLEDFELYKKKKITFGYIKTTDIFDSDSIIMIRTLEGDVNVTISDEMYLMLDITGAAYPIMKDKFDEKYIPKDQRFEEKFEYPPKIRNVFTGEVVDIMQYAKQCVSNGQVQIYAKELSMNTKIFSKWDYDNYMYGKVGDFIAFNKKSPEDVYIINREIFFRTYESVN